MTNADVLDELHLALSGDEQQIMEAVSGRGEALEEVAAGMNIPLQRALDLLRSACDKAETFFAERGIGGGS